MDLKAILESEAAGSFETIQRDLERVGSDWRLRAMLEHISRHLFSADLTVGGMKRACSIADNAVVLVFHRDVGMTPKSYIRERRFEVAARLLVRHRKIRIWQIAELLGYSSLTVFSRAFKKWSSLRPNAFRRSLSEYEIFTPSWPTSLKRVDPALLLRVLAGQADELETGTVFEMLKERYPKRFCDEAAGPLE